MSNSVAEFKARIVSELKILGSFTADIQTTLVREAVITFIRKVDKPVISANLTIVADTSTYDIPAAIDKMVDCYDGTTQKQYSRNDTKRTIKFNSTPTADDTWTVYGTPRNVKTNIDTVVTGLAEEHEDVVFAYIRAFAMRQAGATNAYVTELQAADKAAKELRRSNNRTMDNMGVPLVFNDTLGRVIADASNAEGRSADIDDWLESDF